jgi:hypothetical protein
MSHGQHSLPSDAGVTFRTPFNYRFMGLQNDPDALLPEMDLERIYAALDRLGAAMVDQDGSANDSKIPPIMTYWGQFIDHDVTLSTDRDSGMLGVTNVTENMRPNAASIISANLTNGRRPTLDLDSVYGDGPSFRPSRPSPSQALYQGGNPELFRIGEAAVTGVGVLPPPTGDLNRDLPRHNKKAIIAEERNDENLVIAQFHLAVLRFHNAAVAVLDGTPKKRFDEAKRLTTLHYQWLIANQYLPAICEKKRIKDIRDNASAEWVINDRDGLYMPFEFSVAGFRFGHTMVRSSYDFNRNFGDGAAPLLPRAPFSLLFQFTGGGRPVAFPAPGTPGGLPTLPDNWIIEWERFTRTTGGADRHARRIDTRLVDPLHEMQNQGTMPDTPIDIKALLKNLARRNLRRGFQLRMPTGQAIARSLGLPVLTPDQVASSPTKELHDAVLDGGFAHRTPLWFYILKEAQVQQEGESLGALGTTIVGQTLIGLLKADPRSALNVAWKPSDSPLRDGNRRIDSIERFLSFSGVM